MSSIDSIEVQFGLAHDCIRACVFADHIARTKPQAEAWLSICDMCYSDAVMAWNSLFGANSQSSHWKKMAEILPIPSGSNLKPFGLSIILDYIRVTEDQWKQYHQDLVSFRNNRLAHFRTEISSVDVPNITWALHSACLYREWLIQLLKAQQHQGKNIKVTETTQEEMLATFRRQISEVCK
ncbi:hypothetical protein [Quatrionicoccus australiensis]|uniref:hypothetical protein n=1 Tax=Quatrionicoccus australiensis TaxID=138118 RepID=UPI001CFA73C3|nr:hypothetical protein [Quatrionicoccus australiensis]MCB4358292.1 hypothetical protein [Quatrionicoccus australiensis]